MVHLNQNVHGIVTPLFHMLLMSITGTELWSQREKQVHCPPGQVQYNKAGILRASKNNTYLEF